MCTHGHFAGLLTAALPCLSPPRPPPDCRGPRFSVTDRARSGRRVEHQHPTPSTFVSCVSCRLNVPLRLLASRVVDSSCPCVFLGLVSQCQDPEAEEDAGGQAIEARRVEREPERHETAGRSGEGAAGEAGGPPYGGGEHAPAAVPRRAPAPARTPCTLQIPYKKTGSNPNKKSGYFFKSVLLNGEMSTPGIT